MSMDFAVPLAAATETLVLRFNPRRAWALIVNDGANVAYVQLERKASVANEGIRINPNGGSWEINATNPYCGEVRGISIAGTTLLITEQDVAS